MARLRDLARIQDLVDDAVRHEGLGDFLWGPPASLSGTLVAQGFNQLVFDLPARPGRRGRDDGYYAWLASLYVDRLRARSRRPNADLAAQLDWPVSRVEEAVRQARSRGLLTSVGSGVAGGELTQRGIAARAQWLKEQKKRPGRGAEARGSRGKGR
jgi:hypothetical protein